MHYKDLSKGDNSTTESRTLGADSFDPGVADNLGGVGETSSIRFAEVITPVDSRARSGDIESGGVKYHLCEKTS